MGEDEKEQKRELAKSYNLSFIEALVSPAVLKGMPRLPEI
jgi:hypothetical protein